VDEEHARDATRRLERELAASGLELVSEVVNPETEIYAFVARNATAAFLSFRGSATVRNVMTDLDFTDDAVATAELVSTCGRPGRGCGLSDGVQLHQGFCKAYLSVRQELLGVLDSLPAGLDLHVTGHSMGGALAMLASLDIRAREPAEDARRHRTYTYAAPRLGCISFAALFDRAFPAPADHWALQAPSDAVPHLPFAAWGFKHPHGVLKLAERAPDDSPSASLSADRGDSVRFLRPREGKPANWASCHDISVYSDYLRAMIEGAPSTVGDAAIASTAGEVEAVAVGAYRIDADFDANLGDLARSGAPVHAFA